MASAQYYNRQTDNILNLWNEGKTNMLSVGPYRYDSRDNVSILFPITPAPPPSSLPTDGLDSWWFESASGLSATQVIDNRGDETRDVQEGLAYLFDGVDDYINVGNDSAFNFTTGEFSLCMWIKPATDVRVNVRLLERDSGTASGWALYESGGILKFRASNAGKLDILSTLTVTDNVWNFIGVTRSGTTLKFYIDTSSETKVLSTSPASVSTDLLIGKYAVNDTKNYDGAMFDLRVFDKELSSAEIDSVRGFESVALANLVAQYKGDEQIESVSYDSSGNERHGTITNATLSTFHSTQTATITSSFPGYSWQNQLGYTLSDGATYYKETACSNLIPSGTYIPRDENNVTKCTAYITGGTQASLQYTDRAKFNLDLISSNCLTFDGVNDKLTFTDIPTGATIDSYEGTATPAIDTVNDEITSNAGTLYNIVVKESGGAIWAQLPCSEGGLSDETYDVSGNDNHATLSGFTLASAWGATQNSFHYNITSGFSSMLLFDGSTTYVDLGTSSTLRPASQVRVEAEVYLNGAQGDPGWTSFVCATDAESYDLGFVEGSDIFSFTIWNGSTFKFANSAAITDRTVAYTVIGVWDGSDVKIIVNGTEYAGDACSSIVYGTTTTNVYLGRDVSPAQYYLKGNISKVAIYSDADGNTPVAIYNIDECSGATIVDSSGSNNGTITNASWLRIPAKDDESSDVLGLSIKQPYGAWHNNAETKFNAPQAPELVYDNVVDTNDFLFDTASSNDQQDIGYADIIKDVGPDDHAIMSDTSVTNKKKNLAVYNPALTGSELTQAQDYLNH